MSSSYLQSAWIDLYLFPYGRMVYAVREVRSRATALNLTRVVGAVDRTLTAASEWRELSRRWDIANRRRTERRFGDEAVALDPQLDAMLGGLDRFLDGIVAMSRRQPERAERAARVRETSFPRGVGKVTGLSFEQQHAEVAELLALLDGELAEDVEALGLEPMREDLRELNAEFGAAIAFEGAREAVTFDQVEAAQARAQSALLGLIAVILGHYPYDDDAQDLERRTHLLAPIQDQREAIARSYRRKSTVRDIDPETGHDVPAGASLGAQPEVPEPAPV